MTMLCGIPTDTINAIAGMITALSAAGAAIFAYRGLKTWRAEMLGRRKAELAEDVLADFYQMRDVFVWVRSPGGFGEEAAGRPREDNEDRNLANQLDAYFVPLARLHKDGAFLSAFYAKRYRFRAVFGENAHEPFLEVREVQTKITVAARMLIRSAKQSRGKGPIVEQAQKEIYIWDSGDKDDPLTQSIDAAVAKIEALCRPAIEARAK